MKVRHLVISKMKIEKTEFYRVTRIYKTSGDRIYQTEPTVTVKEI